MRSREVPRSVDAPAARPGRGPVTLLLLGAAVALLLAGCGSDADEETTAAADSAVTGTTNDASGGEPTIPDLPRNDDPSAVTCTGPPQGTFDATAVVGEPVAEAKQAAVDEGCQIRVAMRDGESLALTQDYRPDRVNVAVEDGEVTEIIDIG